METIHTELCVNNGSTNKRGGHIALVAEKYMLTSRHVYKSQHLQCIHSMNSRAEFYASSAAAKALCFSAIRPSVRPSVVVRPLTPISRAAMYTY